MNEVPLYRTPEFPTAPQREFFIYNLLVRIHFIIVMNRWTGLAPWEFEFPFSRYPYIYLPSLHLRPTTIFEQHLISDYRGTSLIINCPPPPRTTIGP